MSETEQAAPKRWRIGGLEILLVLAVLTAMIVIKYGSVLFGG